MNCQDFNDRLHEYLDEALSRDDRAAAREHLRHCGHCRRALLREKTVAQSVRHSLERATAGLSIRTEVKRRVLEALEAKSAPSNTWLRAWQRFVFVPSRPAGAAAALLVVWLLFLRSHFHRQAGEDSGLQVIAQGDPDACTIDVPIQTQSRVLRRQKNAIVDAIISSATIGRAHFPDNSERRSKPR